MAIWPNANERTYVDFRIFKGGFWVRYVLSGVLFTAGLVLSFTAENSDTLVYLPLILAGHLPLWTRRQTMAPAPVRGKKALVWTPVDADWIDSLDKVESRARKWDLSWWDASNPLFIITLLVFAIYLAGSTWLLGQALGDWDDPLSTWVTCNLALWVPLVFNGQRSPWLPNQLTIRGMALELVGPVVEREAPDQYDTVSLLGLREGKRGRYPDDARLMLRPKHDDGSGFIGVQVQVCLNSVRGRNYPYVYCVVLAKPGFSFPTPGPLPADMEKLVVDPGDGDDATYLVVRQHATSSSGWHTESEVVDAIVRLSLKYAKAGREENSKTGKPQ
jgi:hypothetical protein